MVDQTRTLTVLAEGIERLIEKIDQLDVNRNSDVEKSRSTSSIQVHAGGAATWLTAWICSGCAAFMAGTMLIGGFWVSRELTRNETERAELRRADNDMRDYIAAIYQAAPELQKRIEKDRKE